MKKKKLLKWNVDVFIQWQFLMKFSRTFFYTREAHGMC